MRTKVTSKTTPSPTHWLVKSEPHVYPFSQLLKDRKTNWNGVRNFQARNFLKTMNKGDLVLYYHSGDERSAVGIARVLKEFYPDLDPKKPGEWVQVDLEPIEELENPVTLTAIKANTKLKNLMLIKQSRLSVMPVSEQDFQTVLAMAQKSSQKGLKK